MPEQFESTTVPSGFFRTLRAGQSFGAWRVTAGNLDLYGPGIWQAADGRQVVDLNGTADGTLA